MKKLDSFIKKNRVFIYLFFAWLLCLGCVQVLFYKITKTEADNFSLSIKALLQNELNISNPQLASRILLTLEQVGLTQCTQLSIIEEKIEIPFLDLTFKNICEDDYLSFQTFKVEAKYIAANNTAWKINFYKKSSDSLYYSLIALRFLIFLIFVFFIYFYLKDANYRKALFKADIENEKNKNKINAAIAQTTQMLAHDVRKPFTTVESLLQLLDAISTVEEIKELVNTYSPEVKRALRSVNGMIDDVMEVGAETIPVTEVVDAGSLISTSIYDVFRFNEHADINFSYDLNHKHQLQINPLKILRVFSNILGNAAQAMNNKGNIWIKTREVDEVGRTMIEFCLGNSGSFIEKADLENLFEAFFTKNKKGGTGLGLAIAKKVVTSHGGSICCESSKDVGVEFFFTLPVAVYANKSSSSDLPLNSKKIYLANVQIEKVLPASTDLSSTIANESNLLSLLANSNKKIQVVVVDDESIYSHLVKNFVNDSVALKNYVECSVFDKAKDAEIAILEINPDLVLMDVDLGTDINGFELSAKLRHAGFRNKLCIHSNRGLFEFNAEFSKSLADLMIPKPMTKAQFLNLLLSIVKVGEVLTVNKLIPKHIIVLDDSKLVLRAWKLMAKDYLIKTYASPELFFVDLDIDSELLKNASCIITDNDFSSEKSVYTGLDFVKKVKAQVDEIPIYLFSGGEFENQDLEGLVDEVLPKDVKAAWDLVFTKVIQKS